MDLDAQLSGRVGNRFVLEREVGRGGVGVVYRAWDTVTEQQVALKVVAAAAGLVPVEDERLMREGEILTLLNHPAIVKTIAWGQLDDWSRRPYVAMEWLEGEDLAARQRRSPLDLNEVVSLGIAVADALAAAHDAGVVHRDIKPGNLFLCAAHDQPKGSTNCPKIVDFGLAVHESLGATRAGDFQGTLAYMAPEQARGDGPIDQRADIYSLGATLFELIAGRPPHIGPSPIATLARLATTEAPRLGELRRGLPPELEALIGTMLETRPALRPSTMQEVSSSLEGVRDCVRASLADVPDSRARLAQRLGGSASRLVTTLVGLGFESAEARERAIALLEARGATPVPLGADAVVVHLGAVRAFGTEALTALELARRLARLGGRVGVASGRTRIASSGAGMRPVGEVVDRASTLAREASTGQVLADVTTAELGRGRFVLRTRSDGAATVGEPIRGLQGEGVGGAPFVGREAELAQILGAFERSRRDSSPILVSLTGPPGIGKTRLRSEVVTRSLAAPESPLLVLQRNDAYGAGHTLGAAADILRNLLGIPKGVSSNEAVSAITRQLGPHSRDELTSQNRALLGQLLADEPLPAGVDPAVHRDALWLAMTDLVLQVLVNQPVALILEDLQWADVESLAWIDHLLGRAQHRSLFVLGMVRPAFWAKYPDRFCQRDHIRLELRPISVAASRAIATALLGNQTSDEVLDTIAQQSGGLPLFAVELARLAASGRDARRAPTLEAAIQASLDALGDVARDAVGRLSVFGLAGWDLGLEALGMNDAEVLLRELVASDVLVEQVNSRFPGTREWTFKHALVREVAYTSLGDEERVRLHMLAADWLARAGEDAALVARHFDLGGAPERAAEHWERGARRALLTYALTDAVSMAERAVAFAASREIAFRCALLLDDAWSRLDPRSAERETAVTALQQNAETPVERVRARAARVLFDDARGAAIGSLEALREVRDEVVSLNLGDEEERVGAALAMRLAFQGRLSEAEDEARRLLALADTRQIKGAAVGGWQTLAIVNQAMGRPMEALDARRRAVDAAHSVGLKERESTLTTNLGFALVTLGARSESRAALETGLALADAVASSAARRHAEMNLLGWSASFGPDRALESLLARTRADADAVADGQWSAPDRSNLGILFYRGWELVRLRQGLTRARTLLRIAVEGYGRAGHQDLLPVALGVWARAELEAGAAQHAAQIARDAVTLIDAGAPSLLNESTAYLALHDALTATGDFGEARVAIERGLHPLLRRLSGLTGTPYARVFLTELSDNSGLLAAAEGYGLVSDEVHALFERVLSQPSHHP